MNAKTAKLIRKSSDNHASYQREKRQWVRLPPLDRAKLRQAMKESLE